MSLSPLDKGVTGTGRLCKVFNSAGLMPHERSLRSSHAASARAAAGVARSGTDTCPKLGSERRSEDVLANFDRNCGSATAIVIVRREAFDPGRTYPAPLTVSPDE